MSARGRSEDLATVLYLVPFVGALAYGVFLWAQSGISLLLPTPVYLAVTRDPYLFAIGSVATMVGVIIEVNGTDPAARPAKLLSLGSTLQSIAVAALALVLICAFYTNGFVDVSGAATDFIVGRYGIVFPATLVLFSYLITAQFRFAALGSRKSLAVIAMLLVPVSLYEIGRRQIAAGIIIAFVFLLAGVALYLLPERKVQPEKQG